MTKTELNAKFAAYKMVELQLKEIEAQKKALREEIVKEFKKNTTLSTKEFVATLTESTRSIIDSSKIKEDGLFDKYKKESKVLTLSITKK